MKWNDYFNSLKFFLETALGKEIEIESFFGKRVFKIADPDKADEILFIVYNLQTGECIVLRDKDYIFLPMPVKDLKIFPDLPSGEKIPERFVEDFLCFLKIEKRKQEEKEEEGR